jgi:aromatic ring-opening dioxygenase catalytic subunit (LigB family)
MESPMTRMPLAYVPHGGGPWPFVETGFDRKEHDALATYFRELPAIASVPPSAVLSISAHWEERVPTVMTAARPPLLYDYYGFPEAAYRIDWPAPGSPQVAARVRALLDAAGFESAEDPERGFDHGTFVPFKLAWPEANVPTLQLSLVAGLDPAQHLALGRALAPLRDEGVLMIGSGLSYHNMRGFRDPSGRGDAERFDAWLRASIEANPTDRDAALTKWSEAPSARACHPREEHLLPLMVTAGAAGRDRGRTAWSNTVFGMRVSAFHFG